MKTVTIRYPSSTGPMVQKFKVPESHTVAKFRSLIVKTLSQFKEDDFVLSQDEMVLNDLFLISNCAGGKKIRLQLVPKSVMAYVEFPNLSIKQYNINTQISVLENIQEIIGTENSEYYVLAFKPFEEPTIVKTVALSFPLFFQKWTGEKLFLVRRITPSNLINLSNEKIINDFYLNCKKLFQLKLTIFMNQTLISLGVLQYRIENCETSKTINKQDLFNILPNWVNRSLKNEEKIDDYLNKARNLYMKLPKIEAELEYIKISANNGSLCFFYDNVKFQIVERKWKVKTNRYLHISPTIVYISKSHCGKPRHQSLTSSIKAINIEDDTVIYKFENGKTWKIISEHPQILYVASKEIYDISKNEVIKNNEIFNFAENEIIENTVSEEQDDIDDEYFVPYVSSRCIRRNIQNEKPLPGVSLPVFPDAIEPDEPYSVDDKYYRDLKIVEELELIPYNKEDYKKEEQQSSLLCSLKFYLSIFTIIFILCLFKK